MPLVLALECSTVEGSLALFEFKAKNFNCLADKKWTHQALNNSHSDRLPLEVDSILKKSGKKLSEIQFLAVGSGPGRWTGVRTALSVIRSLSFSLKIPIYSVNSLRISVEPFLKNSQAVFSAVNGFKNQVYFAEFYSPEDLEGQIRLLSFEDWLKYMENKISALKEKPICISDLEDFYPIPSHLKSSFTLKKAFPEALHLAQIVFKQKEKIKMKNWKELKALYLRGL